MQNPNNLEKTDPKRKQYLNQFQEEMGKVIQAHYKAMLSESIKRGIANAKAKRSQ